MPINLAFLTIILSFALSASALSDEILISGEDFCPHNCQPGTDKPGYLIEIARHIFGQAGHSLKYVNIPWTRALQGTRHGAYHGIVGVGPAEAPDFIFPENKLGIASHRFFTTMDSTWRYNDKSSLESVVIGAIQDYSYGTFYYWYIEPNIANEARVQVIKGLHGLERNLKKLATGRIDAFVEDNAVVNYQGIHHKLGIKLRDAGVADAEDLYIAFSPQHEKSTAYAKLLSEGINDLRNSGALSKILAKYGMHDWEGLRQ